MQIMFIWRREASATGLERMPTRRVLSFCFEAWNCAGATRGQHPSEPKKSVLPLTVVDHVVVNHGESIREQVRVREEAHKGHYSPSLHDPRAILI